METPPKHGIKQLSLEKLKHKKAENVSSSQISHVVLGHDNTVLAIVKKQFLYHQEGISPVVHVLEVHSIKETPETVLSYFEIEFSATENRPSVVISEGVPNSHRWLAHNICKRGHLIITEVDSVKDVQIVSIQWDDNNCQLYSFDKILSIQQIHNILFVYTIAYKVVIEDKIITQDSNPTLVVVSYNIVDNNDIFESFDILGNVHQVHVHSQQEGLRFSIRNSENAPWITLNVRPFIEDTSGSGGSSKFKISYITWREYGTRPWNVPVTGLPSASAFHSIANNTIDVYVDEINIVKLKITSQDVIPQWIGFDTQKGEITNYHLCKQGNKGGFIEMTDLSLKSKTRFYVSAEFISQPIGKHQTIIIATKDRIFMRNPPKWFNEYVEDYTLTNPHVQIFVKVNVMKDYMVEIAYEKASNCADSMKIQDKRIDELANIFRQEIPIMPYLNSSDNFSFALDYDQVMKKIKEQPMEPLIGLPKSLFLNMEYIKNQLRAHSAQHQIPGTDTQAQVTIKRNGKENQGASLENETSVQFTNDTPGPKIMVYKDYPVSSILNKDCFVFTPIQNEVNSGFPDVFKRYKDLALLDFTAKQIIQVINECTKTQSSKYLFNFNKYFDNEHVAAIFENMDLTNLKKVTVDFYQEYITNDQGNEIEPLTQEAINTQKTLVTEVAKKLLSKDKNDIRKDIFMPPDIMDLFFKITGIPKTAFDIPSVDNNGYNTIFALANTIKASGKAVPKDMLGLFNCLRKYNQLHLIDPQDYRCLFFDDFNKFFDKYAFIEYLDIQLPNGTLDYQAIFCFLILNKLKIQHNNSKTGPIYLDLDIDKIPTNISELFSILKNNKDIDAFSTENVKNITTTLRQDNNPIKSNQFLKDRNFQIGQDLLKFSNWVLDFKEKQVDLFIGKVCNMILTSNISEAKNMLSKVQDLVIDEKTKKEYDIKHMYYMMNFVALKVLKNVKGGNPFSSTDIKFEDYLKEYTEISQLEMFIKANVLFPAKYKEFDDFVRNVLQDLSKTVHHRALIVLLKTIELSKSIKKCASISSNVPQSLDDLIHYTLVWELDKYPKTYESEIGMSLYRLWYVANKLVEIKTPTSQDQGNEPLNELDIKFWVSKLEVAAAHEKT
jgi:hypothetical protein